MIISVKIFNLQRKILYIFVNKKEVKNSYSGISIRSIFFGKLGVFKVRVLRVGEKSILIL